MQYTIKQAARHTGLSADTLRYYDKQGLLSPRRGDNGYRMYSQQDLDSIKYLCVMRYAGFGIQEIHNVLTNTSGDPSPQCRERGLKILRRKAEELQHKIQQLEKIHLLLQAAVDMVETPAHPARTTAHVNSFILEIFESIRLDATL